LLDEFRNLKLNLNKEVAGVIRNQLNKMKTISDGQNGEMSDSNVLGSSQLDLIIKAVKNKVDSADMLEMMKGKTNKKDTEQQMKALEVVHK
jgi:hypothetical protein